MTSLSHIGLKLDDFFQAQTPSKSTTHAIGSLGSQKGAHGRTNGFAVICPWTTLEGANTTSAVTFKPRVSGSQIHDVRQTCVDSFLRSRFCSMICFVAGHRTLYVAELQKLDVQYILTEIARTYGWNAWTANGYLMFNNILRRALQVSLQTMCHF